MSASDQSRQARKTKGAVIEAFKELVLEERYDDIRVSDIVRESDVGRSTFYEHFRDKDDVLRHSMAGLLAPLASTVDETCDVRKVQWVLDHFQENIRLARGMMNSPTVNVIVSALASLIEERLKPITTSVLPTSLIAAQIAEAVFGLIRAWLFKDTQVPAGQVAEALYRSANEMRKVYMQ